MASLIPYIVFSGNCKEAMEYYAKIFNGKISSIQTFEESPIDVPSEFNKKIFDSELKAGNIHFKASDDLPNHQVTKGNNISLFVSFSDKDKRSKVFNTLAKEGKILFPLDENFGMLKDKYGIQWMIVNEN